MASAPQSAPIVTVEDAVNILRGGGLVGIPTETVYGIAVDARNADALKRLYSVKRRPTGHPVIVHIAGIDALGEWARDIPQYANTLARRFWPGPLTLVLKRAQEVLDAVTGGQDTVGLRVPAHPLALELLKAFDSGIAAPSANRYGRLSPTRIEHVAVDLGTDIDAVLDGGACEVGIESTIVDCSGESPVVLRPGKITVADIEAATGLTVVDPGENSPRTPGTLAAHYSPRAKVRLLRRTEMIEALSSHKGKRLAALAMEVSVARIPAAQLIVVPAVAASYARSLYANLRTLDETGADVILVESPPDIPAWAGVLDRLRRAAHS